MASRGAGVADRLRSGVLPEGIYSVVSDGDARALVAATRGDMESVSFCPGRKSSSGILGRRERDAVCHNV